MSKVFLEPLKRIQVEGFAMYAEPELLFGTLDELCCVTYGFCKEFIHLLLKLTDTFGELSTTEVLAKLFEPVRAHHCLSTYTHIYASSYFKVLYLNMSIWYCHVLRTLCNASESQYKYANVEKNSKLFLLT